MSSLPLMIKERAIDLRSRGYSVKEIAEKLNIPQSTSSLWVRNIKLNKKAQERLQKRKLLGYYRAGLTWKKKRVEEEQRNRQIAQRVIEAIRNDTSHVKLYCALLYWCEGWKNSDSRQGVRFVNSDPDMIRVFLKFFRKSFNPDEKKFRVLMYLHSYHNEQKQKNFWSKVTKIPPEQFYKTFQKNNTKKRIRENYPGCVALHYNDCKIAREIKAIYKKFSEQVGV